MLGSIFTWHVFSPYVLYFSETWDVRRMKLFSEVVAGLPKFHYLPTAATESVVSAVFLKTKLLCGRRDFVVVWIALA